MIIGYARVSTADQSTALQLDALRAAGCEKIFTDKASGADRARPQLEKMLGFARKGDTVVAWKLDRLARSLTHLLEIAERLAKCGVDLKIVTQPIDTSTPAGKVIFVISGLFAELERDLIRERTQAGLAAARARGVKLGRPRKQPLEPRFAPVPFGEVR